MNQHQLKTNNPSSESLTWAINSNFIKIYINPNKQKEKTTNTIILFSKMPVSCSSLAHYKTEGISTTDLISADNIS